MTAKFAYRRAKTPSKAPSAAKPTGSPALPAASISKDLLPARMDAFKQVSVYVAGGAGLTTILIPMGEFEHMKSFAGESDAAVESACVAASLVLEPIEGSSWTELVAGGAMLALMLKFQGRRKVKPGRKIK